jgi:hypothetical protein
MRLAGLRLIASPQSRANQSIQKILAPLTFAAYYIRLRVAVAIGLHHTAFPLGVVWRWRHWAHVNSRR